MEKSKYYTPTIEEFHVGFEYEVQANDDSTEFEKLTITKTKSSFEFMNRYALNNVDIDVRVKYLDKEDIESLGFKLDKNHNNVRFNYLKFPYRLDHVPHKNRLDIYKWGDECDMIGYITIKNKSELKRLLTQLNIK